MEDRELAEAKLSNLHKVLIQRYDADGGLVGQAISFHDSEEIAIDAFRAASDAAMKYETSVDGPPDGYVEGEDDDCQPPEVGQVDRPTVTHYPSCSADYPEKVDVPQHIQVIEVEDGETVHQCVDCGGFVVVDSCGKVVQSNPEPPRSVIRPVPELGSLEEELAGEAWRDEAEGEAERGEE